MRLPSANVLVDRRRHHELEVVRVFICDVEEVGNDCCGVLEEMGEDLLEVALELLLNGVGLLG